VSKSSKLVILNQDTKFTSFSQENGSRVSHCLEEISAQPSDQHSAAERSDCHRHNRTTNGNEFVEFSWRSRRVSRQWNLGQQVLRQILVEAEKFFESSCRFPTSPNFPPTVFPRTSCLTAAVPAGLAAVFGAPSQVNQQ